MLQQHDAAKKKEYTIDVANNPVKASNDVRDIGDVIIKSKNTWETVEDLTCHRRSTRHCDRDGGAIVRSRVAKASPAGYGRRQEERPEQRDQEVE